MIKNHRITKKNFDEVPLKGYVASLDILRFWALSPARFHGKHTYLSRLGILCKKLRLLNWSRLKTSDL